MVEGFIIYYYLVYHLGTGGIHKRLSLYEVLTRIPGEPRNNCEPKQMETVTGWDNFVLQ